MEWGWEIFYGLATVVALSLSWKRGGEIAVLASLVGAMWAFQGLMFWTGQTIAGNLLGPMISGSLLIFAVSLGDVRRSWQGRIVTACLMADLCLHVWFRAKGAYTYSCYVALNVLYIIQLIALGWSGGRIVLVGLGDWLARIWSRRNRVGMVWAREKEPAADLLHVSDAPCGSNMGRNILNAAGKLRGR